MSLEYHPFHKAIPTNAARKTVLMIDHLHAEALDGIYHIGPQISQESVHCRREMLSSMGYVNPSQHTNPVSLPDRSYSATGAQVSKTRK